MTSTDASKVATSLGNFKLTTKNTRTGLLQSVEVGDTKGTFKSVDVGSGMICGMTGRAENLGKHLLLFIYIMNMLFMYYVCMYV